jgi:hypothetical protein
MSETLTGGVTPAPAGLLSRFIGVITSPKATFESVVAHPRWFGMLALVCVTMAVLIGGYLFSEVGQNAWADTALNSMGTPNEQQVRGVESMKRFAGYFGVAQMLIVIPLLYLIVGGILFAIFNAVLGGDATFKQLFSVIVHTGPIGILAQIITIPLNYAQGTLTGRTNLAVLLPMLDEDSFAGKLLGMIDVFLVWQLLVLSMGLAVLYRRRTQPIATTLFVVYAVIAVGVAFFMSRGGGTN